MALGRSAQFLRNVPFLMLCILMSTSGQVAAATKDLTEAPVLPRSKSSTNDILPDGRAIPNDALPVLDQADPPGERLPNIEAPISKPTKLPPVLRDLDLLPAAVRKTHEQIVRAANKANIEGLRSLIGSGDTATSLSIGGLEGDPIEFLKETSGDSDGYEVLAILLEVLEAGFVHMDAGTENEMYIWPYFFAWPFDKLTPQMKVELFRILTAGDVEDSTDFGGYIFYRVGIRPNGHWEFFVAGD